VDPFTISNYLDQFLKQFCLSLRYINNSSEKQEAFGGLCKAIIKNPNGVINHFAFFCDAICQYDNAPCELEETFHNLINSYKNTLREKWFDYFILFPDKLKNKMKSRFNLN
jgi:transportin-1